MSNAPKRKFNLPKPPPPRSMAEIEQEYGRLVPQAGQAQYQLHVVRKDLKRLNELLENLNYEAASRKELDKKEQVNTVTPEVVNAPA